MSLPQPLQNLKVLPLRKKTFKQKRGITIGTKFAPSYSVLFIAKLEEETLSEIKLKPYLWWRYIDDIFFLWKNGEEKLKEFIEHLNEKHLTINFLFWMLQFHL